MTQNTLEIWPEIVGIVGGAAILIIFALAIALRHRGGILPGSSGHREEEEVDAHEEIYPDGYIDSFAGVIEEAGGGLPLVVKIALPGIILWWLVYLIIHWSPR